MTYSIRYRMWDSDFRRGGYVVLLHKGRTTYRGAHLYRSYANAERAAKATGATERK